MRNNIANNNAVVNVTFAPKLFKADKTLNLEVMAGEYNLDCKPNCEDYTATIIIGKEKDIRTMIHEQRWLTYYFTINF